VGLSPAEAEKELAPFRGRLEIAGVNGDTDVNIAGETGALRELGERLALRGVLHRELDLDYAFHSRMMDPVRADLLRALEGLAPDTPHTPMVSSVTACRLPDGGPDAAYWWRNVREPVLFAQAVRALALFVPAQMIAQVVLNWWSGIFRMRRAATYKGNALLVVHDVQRLALQSRRGTWCGMGASRRRGLLWAVYKAARPLSITSPWRRRGPRLFIRITPRSSSVLGPLTWTVSGALSGAAPRSHA
jgi:hypothetical protein